MIRWTFPALLAFALMASSCCNSKKVNDATIPSTEAAANASRNDSPLTGTYWKLTELMGKPVAEYQFQKEPFIQIGDDMRVTGNGGCNSMNGPVEIKEGNRIVFGNIATTLKACMDDNIEAQVLDMLKKVDNYAIQGRHLSLNKAKMAPLAKFEAMDKK